MSRMDAAQGWLGGITVFNGHAAQSYAAIVARTGGQSVAHFERAVLTSARDNPS